MAGFSLLTLLDDIVSILDDVAILTKVAAKKTAGVLGDDLALNAEQVAGVKADRELPVIWAVAKGSFLNKFIIVPIALTLSAFFPLAITMLLMIGGLYLCFEGVEKIFHPKINNNVVVGKTPLNHSSNELNNHKDIEKQKIKGAIRTDFILSAEIIVIALGAISHSSLLTQTLVISCLAIVFTIGVYGLVAIIVKLDDAGLYLLNKGLKQSLTIYKILGNTLLKVAPWLMRLLVIVGTIAMFLVGGGIIVHGIPKLATLAHQIEHLAFMPTYLTNIAKIGLPIIFSGVVGIIAGGLVLLFVNLIKSINK